MPEQLSTRRKRDRLRSLSRIGDSADQASHDSSNPPNQSLHSRSPSALNTVGSAVPTIPNQSSLQSPSQDLWEKALHSLDKDDQNRIERLVPDFKKSSATDVLDDLCAITREKRAECEDKRWKFCFNGKELILRDVAEKIIVWLDKFKQIGDVIATVDPFHVGLPWAGVRFLLQV